MENRARRKSDDEEENTDAWMMTYGDLVTQLLCFFILLMSFSVISSMKFREVVVSLQEALSGSGALPAWRSVIDDVPRNFSGTVDDEKLAELKSALEEQLERHNMLSYVETEIRKEGLVIILEQHEPPVFFDTGDARIKEEAYPILDQIGQLIKNVPNDIRVEGHTDIRPIHTPQYPSNWELSTMRATNVLRYLNEKVGIAPERLSAAGYGPYRPIAPNDTEAGMSKNRRVEIVVLRMEKVSKQSPDTPSGE